MGTRRNYWSDSAHSWLRTHIQLAGRQEKKVQVASPRPAEVVFNTQAPLASLFIHLNDSPALGPLPPPTFPRSTIKINYFSLLINLRPAPSFKELKKKKKKKITAPRASEQRLISKQDLCGAGILKQLES